MKERDAHLHHSHNESECLASPQFTQESRETAYPVQPLVSPDAHRRTRPHSGVRWSRRIQIRAVTAVTVIAFLAAAAAGLMVGYREQAATITEPEISNPAVVETSNSISASPSAQSEIVRVPRPRARLRSSTEDFSVSREGADDSQPVARKVGEIGIRDHHPSRRARADRDDEQDR